MLTINLEYSNLVNGQVDPWSHDVHAFARPTAQENVWGGWGAQTTFTEYPSGTAGSQSYHKVSRYRQGVVVQFMARGRIYAFDHFALLNLLIASVVLLRICSIVTDFIAFWLLPNGLSTVLASRREREGEPANGIRQLRHPHSISGAAI